MPVYRVSSPDPARTQIWKDTTGVAGSTRVRTVRPFGRIVVRIFEIGSSMRLSGAGDSAAATGFSAAAGSAAATGRVATPAERNTASSSAVPQFARRPKATRLSCRRESRPTITKRMIRIPLKLRI